MTNQDVNDSDSTRVLPDYLLMEYCIHTCIYNNSYNGCHCDILKLCYILIIHLFLVFWV